MNKLYITILLLGICFNIEAQNSYRGEVRLENSNVERKGNEIYVDATVVFDRFKIKPQRALTVKPMLLDANGLMVQDYDPIMVVGKRRWMSLRRAEQFKGKTIDVNPQFVLERNFALNVPVPIHIVLPLNDETNGASINIEEFISGCNNCTYDQKEPFVIQIPYFKMEYVFTVVYVVPEPEPIKLRNETHSAHLNYEVNKFDVRWDFKNNAEILKDVSKIISDLRDDSNMTINEFKVIGYASPDGNAKSNQELSEKRANSFLNYLSSMYGFNTNIIQAEGRGEDWEGLRKFVNNSPMEQKEQVLNIIDNTPDIPERKKKIMNLSGGSVYKALLRDFYPYLRRNEYTISYAVKPFDVDEAKDIIKTRPSLLSLNEMYLVAETYPKDSDEFKEVFDIATRIYPEDPVAKLNAAALDIENGNLDRAIRRLLDIDTPESWNNLGVAYAKKDEMELAKQYFEKAANMNVEQAKINLYQFEE